MCEFKVMLKKMETATDFSSLCGNQEFDIDAVSGKYTVDAKSILGILSLSITQPITIKCNCAKKQAAIFKERLVERGIQVL